MYHDKTLDRIRFSKTRSINLRDSNKHLRRRGIHFSNPFTHKQDENTNQTQREMILTQALRDWRVQVSITIVRGRNICQDRETTHTKRLPARTESTSDLNHPSYAASTESHSTFIAHEPSRGVLEPYPAWTAEQQIPMACEEIEDIFFNLTQKFGFQSDSMRNMVRLVHGRSFSW